MLDPIQWGAIVKIPTQQYGGDGDGMVVKPIKTNMLSSATVTVRQIFCLELSSLPCFFWSVVGCALCLESGTCTCTCNSKHKGKKSFLIDKMMFVEVNQFLLLDLLFLGGNNSTI